MLKTVKKSLNQLLGETYMNAVYNGAVTLHGMDQKKAQLLMNDEVDFLPESFIKKMNDLIPFVGKNFLPPITNTLKGAATTAFDKATNVNASPVSGLGFLRLGEDGRLYLVSKSEHYHTPLGHAFPGYNLIDNAKMLGITNATHNNTRGYITRFLEMELVRTANGIDKNENNTLQAVLASKEPHVLNRVINLETGSLACEAGIKMMLSRFYRIDKTLPKPKYSGKIPVFFVIADNNNESTANYHGTTIMAQTFRNLWPEIYENAVKAEIYKVCPVNINDFEDFKEKFIRYNTGEYKAAGFLHEIILMNYGGIKLEKEFLHKVYTLCHENDTPTMVDEIQTCMWYPSMFLFREYELNPDFVVIGKGFPGGQYPASRIITTYEMDNLNLFGALVTNGQEELSALAYLITMEFTQANGEHIRKTGSYYFDRLLDLQIHYPRIIEKIEGLDLLASICFYQIDDAVQFASALNKEAIDISAQTYKPKCPPAVLTKIPVISTVEFVDYLVTRMDDTLKNLNNKGANT